MNLATQQCPSCRRLLPAAAFDQSLAMVQGQPACRDCCAPSGRLGSTVAREHWRRVRQQIRQQAALEAGEPWPPSAEKIAVELTAQRRGAWAFRIIALAVAGGIIGVAGVSLAASVAASLIVAAVFAVFRPVRTAEDL